MPSFFKIIIKSYSQHFKYRIIKLPQKAKIENNLTIAVNYSEKDNGNHKNVFSNGSIGSKMFSEKALHWEIGRRFPVEKLNREKKPKHTNRNSMFMIFK